MNRFKQHIPDFVTLDEYPDWIEFNNKEELLQLEVVQRFKEYGEFSHYALKDKYFMAIYNKGSKWKVIGYIENPDALDFPQWRYKNEKKI